jgi:hypothetical protein
MPETLGLSRLSVELKFDPKKILISNGSMA